MVKKCDLGLENAARGRTVTEGSIFKPKVTVFHNTDQP